MCARRVCKNVSYVADAQEWVDGMIRKEMLGGCKQDEAMRNLANRYRISHGDFWKLKFRPPKGIDVGLYVKIGEAYHNECLRQEGLLANDRKRVKEKVLSIKALRRSLSAVDGREGADTLRVAGGEG